MGGNGKHRWKLSFYHRSSSPQSGGVSPATPQQPPEEFLCPISGSLMSDPVIVSSGQTFERVSVQVCRELRFSPVLSDDGSTPDFTTLIPNRAIKSTILNWCHASGIMPPVPPDYYSVENVVRAKMVLGGGGSGRSLPSPISTSTPDLRVSERELLRGVAEIPQVMFSHANTEFTHRVNHFPSSSSDECVIMNAASPLTPLPLTTRPACYASSSISNSSSEFLADVEGTLNSGASPEEEEIVMKLKSGEVHEQEEGVVRLRRLTRSKEETRISLSTPRLLAALKSLIESRYALVQTNAIASLVNLSLEKANKVKIVRSGFVPLLIDVLKSGSSEPQEHAAGALFSLALEDENKMAIGVLGALQPLMYAIRSESERTRHDSGLALYHLSLVQSNRVKLVKLGAVSTLLSMVRVGDSANRLLLILCNLASCNEGRSAMLDANAVSIMVGMLREGSEGSDLEATRENCVAVLFALSHGSLRFKGLAKEERAVEVLKEIEETGSDRAREKARRILLMMRGRGEDEDEDIDWEGALDAGGGLTWTRYRVGVGNGGRNVQGPNSTNF